MKIIEGIQIRTNPNGSVVWMSDWTRWLEFVKKGYFYTKEIKIAGGPIRSDTQTFLADNIEQPEQLHIGKHGEYIVATKYAAEFA